MSSLPNEASCAVVESVASPFSPFGAGLQSMQVVHCTQCVLVHVVNSPSPLEPNLRQPQSRAVADTAASPLPSFGAGLQSMQVVHCTQCVVLHIVNSPSPSTPISESRTRVPLESRRSLRCRLSVLVWQACRSSISHNASLHIASIRPPPRPQFPKAAVTMRPASRLDGEPCPYNLWGPTCAPFVAKSA